MLNQHHSPLLVLPKGIEPSLSRLIGPPLYLLSYGRMVTPTGFEPAISRLRVWCPSQLDDGVTKYKR
jgi:hypothetical protein